MAQPMLKIEAVAPDGNTAKAVPNLVPCRIHHNGPVDGVQDYWDPKQEGDVKRAYFRGRKLQGRKLKVPEGYRGVVAVTSREESKAGLNGADAEQEHEAIDAEQDEGPAMGYMKVEAAFDEMVIWGHESTADAATDPYVRGMEEWLQFSKELHSHGTTGGG